MDHVLTAVVLEPKNLQDTKLCTKCMAEHVQAQVKSPSLVIPIPTGEAGAHGLHVLQIVHHTIHNLEKETNVVVEIFQAPVVSLENAIMEVLIVVIITIVAMGMVIVTHEGIVME